MIPASELFSHSVGAASNGFNVQFHPLHIPKTTGRSAPCTTLRKLDCPSRLVPLKCAAKTTAVIGLRCSSLSNSQLQFRRRGGRAEDVGRRLCSCPFLSFGGVSILRVRATEAAAASPDEFSYDAPEHFLSGQNSRASTSVTEREESLPAMDAEDSREDAGKVKMKTTVLQSQSNDDKESESETMEQEYKLTDEGTLTTVEVSRGGITKKTYTKVDRAIAEVGMQAELLHHNIQNFSVRKFIRNFGKKEPGLEDLKFNAAMYEPKEGVSNISHWTAMELTMQRAQMLRIAKDTLYLVWAFSLFGIVRILEAVATVFATSPPNFMKIFDAMNALDPLTVASLAYALRQPIIGMLDVDPTNLEEVCSLRAKFWAELHKFYERQWKVMATLGVARMFALIVMKLPSAEWITKKVKVLWDISMALPIF